MEHQSFRRCRRRRTPGGEGWDGGEAANIARVGWPPSCSDHIHSFVSCYFIFITYIYIHNCHFYPFFSCPPASLHGSYIFLEGVRQRVRVQSVSCMQSFPDCCFCHPHPGDQMQDGSSFPLTCLTYLMCSCMKYFPSRQWKCHAMSLLVTWAYSNKAFLTRQHFRGLCPVKYPPVLDTARDLKHTAHTCLGQGVMQHCL